MKTVKKRSFVFGVIIYIATLALVIASQRLRFIGFVVNKYATILYNDNLIYKTLIEDNWLILAFAGVGFWFSRKGLGKSGGDYRLWIVAWLYDLLSYFMAVFIQVLYNNYIYKEGGIVQLSSVENVILFYVFLLLKRPLLFRFLIRKASLSNN